MMNDLLVADPRIEPPDVYWSDRDSDAVCVQSDGKSVEGVDEDVER